MTPHERLDKWCAAKSGRTRDLSQECDVTSAAVTHWRQGVRMPAGHHWIGIEKLTGIAIGAWAKEAVARAKRISDDKVKALRAK